MKKVARIIPLLNIVILSVLFIFYEDVKELEQYTNYSNYQVESVILDEKTELTMEQLKELQKIANDNNVLLEKRQLNQNITEIYLSLESIQYLEKFLNREFIVHKMNNSKNNISFISTEKTKSQNQIGYIKDLLGNQHFSYYTFDSLYKNSHLYGTYHIYYQHQKDYQKFNHKLEELLGQVIHPIQINTEIKQYIKVISIITTIIMLFFYFLFEVYNLYKNSARIGCMKLLGFSTFKINQILIGSKIKIYSAFMIFLSILLLFIIKNITLMLLIKLFFIHLCLLLLIYCIHYYCVFAIAKGESIVSLLKQKNISLQIFKISCVSKVLITLVLLIQIPLFICNIKQLPDIFYHYRKYKKVLDYGVFSDYLGFSSNKKNYEKHIELYTKILNDSKLETFYVDLGELYYDKEPEWLITAKKEGTYIPYGSVDRNYLQNETIRVYELDGQEVDIKTICGVFFLFPKDRKNEITKFLKYYEKESIKDYQKHNMDFSFQVYLYDEQKLPTYDLETDYQYVDDVILRVIDSEFKISYMETAIGIQIFGLGMSTGLKIKSNQDTFTILNEHIKELDLNDLLSKQNFVTYNQYLGTEIKELSTKLILLGSVIILFILVYIMVITELFYIYIKNDEKRILVKKLLGYSMIESIEPIFKWNFKLNIIIVIISLILLLLLNLFYCILYCASIVVFIFIDSIILSILIRLIDVSMLNEKLKGGNL